METPRYCITEQSQVILNQEFMDISGKNVREYDISKVHGSVRLRTGDIRTPEDVMKLKREVKSLKFPSKK